MQLSQGAVYLYTDTNMNFKFITDKVHLYLLSPSVYNFYNLKGGCNNFQYFDHKFSWHWD